MVPGRHFCTFGKPLLPAYFALRPGWALAESTTEPGRQESVWEELTATLCTWYIIVGAGQVDFFQGAPVFPHGPGISYACRI